MDKRRENIYMAVKSKEDPNIEILKNENIQLKNELEEIKKLLLNLNTNQQTQEIIRDQKSVVDDEEDFEITPNKYIKVMSLNFGKLVLTTEGRGQGKAFIFQKYGDVRNIMYTDLSNLYHHQQSFAEQGRFFIFDKKFIKNHGLTQYYNKFLTKEVVDNILNYQSDEIVNLFKNTTDAQKEIIVNLLIKKIVNNETVDIAKVDILSRLWGQNIYDIARAKMNILEEES